MNRKTILLVVAGVVIGLGAVGAIRYNLKLQGEKAAANVLEVGYLPVTCHLTCPVTDFATSKSTNYRFVSHRFTDFPTMAEAYRIAALEIIHARDWKVDSGNADSRDVPRLQPGSNA